MERHPFPFLTRPAVHLTTATVGQTLQCLLELLVGLDHRPRRAATFLSISAILLLRLSHPVARRLHVRQEAGLVFPGRHQTPQSYLIPQEAGVVQWETRVLFSQTDCMITHLCERRHYHYLQRSALRLQSLSSGGHLWRVELAPRIVQPQLFRVGQSQVETQVCIQGLLHNNGKIS